MRAVNRLLVLCLASAACGSGPKLPPIVDRTVPFDGTFCSLPGAVVHQGTQRYRVAGNTVGPSLDWLTIPDGFCVHYYGTVPNARQVRLAPGGELFVASPTKVTTGGGPNGLSAIEVLPDDDRNGVADTNLTFLANLPAVQGLLFTNGSFYYQDDTRIRRLDYARGTRSASAPGDVVADIQLYVSQLHWPKVLDAADDGTIYVGNGGDQSETCNPARPFHGGLLKLDPGSAGARQVEKGFRNPIALRCRPGKGICFVAELSLDYSGMEGGREKIVQVQAGDLGYPCCATQNMPFRGVSPATDCSKILPESNAFIIGETPFGLEFDAQNLWPAPYTGSLFATQHGEFPSWKGAKLVAIATDPSTGAPLPSSDLSGAMSGGLTELASGWDDGTRSHGRPAALTMAPDGRLFLANDNDGTILWFAPMGLVDPTPP